ncbi:hydantoinase B/oxoprolinase family protein [Virgibacillus dakarensis]|uniref:5-oxoprolinase n=1 Tax=Lentibacillus populi TaxID=1827502 RepID=A0A9W5X6K3_9BACI|nr:MULTISPECIES: hydantoinase B/oxoprolinase family protein [Bacillaceae]MBT2215487.1 hydantoinase B/oxoprolinase family protein [Virgibacillus dakarensis]MTW86224.1 hydantoinase B/oxoprolinase family protein [Virgibacillus dakarensis]GGB52666.1 5-oxoprolinase [Lentibacillus populi]
MNNNSPFVNEVIKDSLLSIGDEMFAALARTSMSPIIYEVLDYACGLTDAQGNLVSQGNGVTSFIGMLSPMVKSVIADHKDDLYEGDIIIINDPYTGGGSHLSDVGLVMPIFSDGKIVAFSANKGHWTEVGGKDPGSFTNDATEIYQEGIQLPGVKLFEKGKLNKAVEKIISTNVRLPKLSIGDMWAQVAALRTGAKRFVELCNSYGSDTVTDVIDNLIKSSETYALKELALLPRGSFEAEDFIEGDPKKGGPYNIKVKVTITDDEFICDYRGSHPQVTNPVNCSYYGLVASVRVMFLAILRPKFNITEGLFKPLRIITDKQSIVSAERPAPVSMNFEARLGGAELIWKALAPSLPDRLSAGHLLSVCSVTLSGVHPDTNDDFLIVEPSVGGWGAGDNHDGQGGQFCMGDGETYNVPIEVAEIKYGVRVKEYSFRDDSSGAGEFIGGKGVVRSYEILSDKQHLSASYGRFSFKPWGMNGGNDGASSLIKVYRKDGEIVGPFGVSTRMELNKGDVAQLVTPSGGGYGDPKLRDKGKVKLDVKNEFFSEEEAEKLFDVRLNDD